MCLRLTTKLGCILDYYQLTRSGFWCIRCSFSGNYTVADSFCGFIIVGGIGVTPISAGRNVAQVVISDSSVPDTRTCLRSKKQLLSRINFQIYGGMCLERQQHLWFTSIKLSKLSNAWYGIFVWHDVKAPECAAPEIPINYNHLLKVLVAFSYKMKNNSGNIQTLKCNIFEGSILPTLQTYYCTNVTE